MKVVFLIWTALLAGWSPAWGQTAALDIQDRIRNPSAPLTSLHAEALVPILRQLGLSHEGAILPGGEKILRVTTPHGARLQLIPMSCDAPERCRALHILSLHEANSNRRQTQAFAMRYAFLSAGTGSDGTAFLSRYELADFGIPRGNLATSLLTFIKMMARFEDLLGRPAEALTQAPLASDLSAFDLNKRALAQHLPAKAIEDALPLHPHDQGFEATSRMVETFIRAEKIYPGQIVNRPAGR
jgi:hypothetical protein